MRRSRFAQEQIIGVRKEHQAGATAAELCRKYGVSDAAFYTWRSKYGGMEVSDARKLKGLEEEHAKLKRLLAESMLDVSGVEGDRHRPARLGGAQTTTATYRSPCV